MELNQFQSAVYSLVKQYIERQNLTLQALNDLRPDLIVQARGRGEKPADEFYRELLRMRAEQPSV